jgi:quinoprotein glucose dehydrogenase
MSHIVLTENILFLAPDGTYSVTGLSNRGTAIVAQATKDEPEPMLYAHDAKSGELVGELKMPGAAFGALMTYKAGGKQYVAVPIGGAGLPAELIAIAVD